jgi:hypothetical protein
MEPRPHLRIIRFDNGTGGFMGKRPKRPWNGGKFHRTSGLQYNNIQETGVKTTKGAQHHLQKLSTTEENF